VCMTCVCICVCVCMTTCVCVDLFGGSNACMWVSGGLRSRQLSFYGLVSLHAECTRQSEDITISKQAIITTCESENECDGLCHQNGTCMYTCVDCQKAMHHCQMH